LYERIIDYLENIYSQIPGFNCQHCHQCCGPIFWFEPEDILIRQYMEKNKIERISWSREEFDKNQDKCPYLINDRCIIYSVRPIVCRLQGNISELRCKSSDEKKLISQEKLNDIKEEFFKLIRQSNSTNVFYSTLKF
jgi:Fe-S-cluster containining protein